ncbi:MAG: hypothetical protein MZU95_01445 [Desulfomicrobium escambiense]|nr:hypothetical protein [Desulfomicrobium escambiense]
MGVFFHMTWLLLAALILVFEFQIEDAPPNHPPVRRRERAARPETNGSRPFVIVAIFVLSFIPEPVRGVGLLDLLKGHAGGF